MNCPHCTHYIFSYKSKTPIQNLLQIINYEDCVGYKFMCMRCYCTYEYREGIENAIWLYNENVDKYIYPIEDNGFYVIPTKHIVSDRKTRNGILIEPIDKNKILREQKYKCVYCGKDLKTNEKHLDHIVPIAKGGAEIQENMQYLCRECNIKKKDSISEEWNNVELYNSLKQRGLLHYHLKNLR